MVWYGMVCYGMVWYGIVWSCLFGKRRTINPCALSISMVQKRRGKGTNLHEAPGAWWHWPVPSSMRREKVQCGSPASNGSSKEPKGYYYIIYATAGSTDLGSPLGKSRLPRNASHNPRAQRTNKTRGNGLFVLFYCATGATMNA